MINRDTLPCPTTARKISPLFRAWALCFSLALFGLAAPLHAATYYVSPAGSDSASGLSPDDAWRTLARVNSAVFSPGDHVLLEGGRLFRGPLKLDHLDSGTAEKPVVISSYRLAGAGPATIDAGLGRGVDVFNMSGLRISHLKIVGRGPDDNTKSGIFLLSNREDASRFVEIDHVEVIGFGRHGISIGAWQTTAGYTDVRITNCSTHDNLRTGVFTWGPWGAGIYAHRSIYIGDTHAYRMKGGSGLTFSSVDGGVIERCVVYDNGREFSGGAGIWAWDSNNILFQFNESYANRTTGVDGDGFDFDGGVTNSVMQYNYSHDNDAAGFLLAQYRHAPQAMENIIIRFNISENDCRKKPYGAIHVWNGDTADRMKNIHIYQNTVYLTPPPLERPGLFARGVGASLRALGLRQPEQVACAMAIISPTTSVSVYNNLFYTTGGQPLVSVVPGQGVVRFQNNAYWSENGEFHFAWMGSSYRSLADWLHAAADQERLGGHIVAVSSDPLLTAPGTGGTLGDPGLLHTLEGYKLRANSPLRHRGVNIPSTFGLDPGERGFFGDPISASETQPPSIGAHLHQPKQG